MGRTQKRIAVTGANGYIGTHVVEALLEQGAEVIAIDLTTENVNPSVQKINADIFSGDPNLFEKLGSPDVCLHLAWKDGFFHNSDSHMGYLSKHFEFISNLMDSGLQQLGVMGSMHEIGFHIGSVDENTPCNPISQYGIAKDALRRSLFLRAQNKEIIIQWLRACYIYGDDKRNHSVFTKLIQAEESGQPFFPFTSGTKKYDFIRIDSLAQMVAASVLQRKVDGIINCCSGIPISLGEIVEAFIRENQFRIKLQYGAFPDRPYDSPEIWGDTTKIKQILKDANITF